MWAWLFAHTTRSAHTSATCYSLIETAKANGLESDAYIHHILEHIAPADMLETLKALLPRHVDFEAITKKSGVIHG
ncbi:transposase domain-containing protein [Vreelandella populi]|uniref:transposase domain-containing protein n=1 Tax=Vreelandella populi TaxID=2498858 RepID=UPI001C8E5606